MVALSHPNVLVVYDVGAQDGMPFVVAEITRRQNRPQLLAWEQVRVSHSWRDVRLARLAGVTCVGVFLVVTQPALQSSLVGIATGLTGVMTTGLKARDAIASWLSRGKVTTSS